MLLHLHQSVFRAGKYVPLTHTTTIPKSASTAFVCVKHFQNPLFSAFYGKQEAVWSSSTPEVKVLRTQRPYASLNAKFKCNCEHQLEENYLSISVILYLCIIFNVLMTKRHRAYIMIYICSNLQKCP